MATLNTRLAKAKAAKAAQIAPLPPSKYRTRGALLPRGRAVSGSHPSPPLPGEPSDELRLMLRAQQSERFIWPC